MFGLLKDLEKITEENAKLKEENRRLKKGLLLKEKQLRFDLGMDMEEYVFKLKNYLWGRRDATLTLISSVEYTDKLNCECFTGLGYGISNGWKYRDS